MTKRDIIRVISEELGLTQFQTSQIVHNLFDAIVNTVAKNGRVELRNFGVFEVRWRKARQGRNPRRGKRSWCPSNVPSSSSLGGHWRSGLNWQAEVRLPVARLGPRQNPHLVSAQHALAIDGWLTPAAAADFKN